MTNKWQLMIKRKNTGHFNMELDKKLFDDFEKGKGKSTLRLYSWGNKALTYGHNQNLPIAEIEKWHNNGWEVVKRPTGGGIVFHHPWEVTYSIITASDNGILPKGLIPSYVRISEIIVEWLNKLGVSARIHNFKEEVKRDDHCFNLSMPYEIVEKERKIVGSAQLRGKKAMLQQGTILVPWDDRFVKELADTFSSSLGISF